MENCETQDATANAAAKAAKPKKEKAPSIPFKTFRNGAPWKTVKAKSFDDAMASVKSAIAKLCDRTNHYEIKNEAGRLVPVL